jgi:hypothetical protein
MWSSMVAQYCPGGALARLALALTIMASLTVGNFTTYAEAAQASALEARGKPDQVAGREVDLESLDGEAAAIAAIARTVYEEASSILDGLAKSSFPDEKVRADTVIALKEVAKLSHRLATASEVLVDAVETASAGPLAGSATLTRALEEFDGAEKAFDRSASELLKRLRRVRSHEVKRERLELQALVRSTPTYGAAQNALMAAISELAPLLAPAVVRAAPTPGISLSVYGFFDRQGSEEAGYGLYTYVLLAAAPGTGQRNVAFLKALLVSTGRTDSALAAVRRQLNIFYVPTRNRIQASVIARSTADAAAAIAASSVYDYQEAQRLLVRFCTGSVGGNPNLCASAWRGPYLLTLPEPLGASAALSPTYLVVDLSGIHERAFGEFIRAVKEQVMRTDFADRERLDTLRLRLLDITLKAADWLDPIKEGIAEIVFFEENAVK